jgi:hypothetical protein
MRKEHTIILLFIFISSVLSAQVTLPPGLYKKGTRPDSAQKRPTPTPKKDSVAVKNNSKESNKEDTEKKADATSIKEEDNEPITFATLEELKKFDEQKRVAKWSNEKKILLYTLYQDRLDNNIKISEQFWKQFQNRTNEFRVSYSNLAKQWKETIFESPSFVSTVEMNSINQLESSLGPLKQSIEPLDKEFQENVKIFSIISQPTTITEYYKILFNSNPPVTNLQTIKRIQDKYQEVELMILNSSKNISEMKLSVNYLTSEMNTLKNKVSSRAGRLGSTTNNRGGVVTTPVAPTWKDVISKNDLNGAKSLFLKDPNGISAATNNTTPLLYAIQSRASLPIVKMMVDYGADINKHNQVYVGAQVAVKPVLEFCQYFDENEPENVAFLKSLLLRGATPYTNMTINVLKEHAKFILNKVISGRTKYLQAFKDAGYDIEGDSKL